MIQSIEFKLHTFTMDDFAKWQSEFAGLTPRQATKIIKSQNPCALCNYSECISALQFHHLDESTKYRTKSGKALNPADLVASGRSLDTVLKEFTKCALVCSNCHAKITARIAGWCEC